LQWIDSASEEFFASFAETLACSPILLVLTYRAGYRPPWIDKSYATQVALLPLAPDESRRVLRSVLGASQISDALAARIVAKAEGNPLFVEELARAVREQGEPAANLAVPDTIQEVLHETSVSPDTEYTFKHALTHEAAYASMPPEQRSALHARIVEAIERRVQSGS